MANYPHFFNLLSKFCHDLTHKYAPFFAKNIFSSPNFQRGSYRATCRYLAMRVSLGTDILFLFTVFIFSLNSKPA